MAKGSPGESYPCRCRVLDGSVSVSLVQQSADRATKQAKRFRTRRRDSEEPDPAMVVRLSHFVDRRGLRQKSRRGALNTVCNTNNAPRPPCGWYRWL